MTTNSTNRPKSSREARQLAEDKARLGRIISDRYELLELLGHGGMGAVYKARHIALDRIVAVKFLLPDVAEDPLMRSRFLREASSSGKMNHPNVIQLIDYGEGAEDEAYIVVEYLDGIGLDQLIKQEGQIEYHRAVYIFKQICSGVAAAHTRKLIHRDLKPSNIMILNDQDEPDFVKVVDFGLAKALEPSEESQRLTMSGEVFGSPVYMAPEQCLGRQLDQRSDIYAMGVLMYEALMGKAPIVGANVAETIARQMNEIPRPFDETRPDIVIPPALEAVVMKALEKDPDCRQSSMAELKMELKAAMAAENEPRTAMTTAAEASPFRKNTATQQLNFAGARSGTASPSPAAAGDFDSSAQVRSTYAASRPVAPPPGARGTSPVLAFVFLGISLLLVTAGVAALCLQHGPSGNSKRVEVRVISGQDSQRQNKGSSPVRETLAYPARDVDVSGRGHGEGSNNTSVNPPPTSSQSSEFDLKWTAAKGNSEKAAERKQLLLRKHSEPAQPEHPKVATTSHPHKTTAASQHKATPEADPLADASSRKHHRDWHDYSYGYENKESFSHSWSVPVAGSHGENN